MFSSFSRMYIYEVSEPAKKTGLGKVRLCEAMTQEER